MPEEDKGTCAEGDRPPGKPLFIEAQGQQSKRRPRGVYWLPNLLTTASLFCGFTSIVQGMNHRFDLAAILCFCALIFDSLDGRVARWTGTTSAFGEQYDSLSDMVSFGAAPALIMYEWALKGLGKFGWVAAFVYVAGAALRLARFNTNLGVVDKRFFQGLPSPAAAAMVVGLIWAFTELEASNLVEWRGPDLALLGWLLTVYAGLTMVSNARFYSGKALDVRYRVPFWVMVLVILGFVLISTNPPLTLFGVFVVYALSGYVLWLWERATGRRIGGETTAIHKSD
ncbi:MAG: CDP-diacylglycerol--serine O-phosphatidyltransferase [Betaproteobacteria bacterium]|nr:CDP-diacylglycerol--serine O-phosphatidyltransferase [Betaproteobacteria bacterium]